MEQQLPLSSSHSPTPQLQDCQKILIDDLVSGSTSDFDLYLNLNGQLTLYAKSPYRWDQGEKNRLLKHGHTVLFYSSAAQSLVEGYRQLSQLKELPKKDIPPEQALLQITDIASDLTQVLYDYGLSPAALAKTQDIAQAMAQTVLADPGCVRVLGLLATHDAYTYYHSARVASYALAIAVQLSQRAESELEKLALGCLLHDIGKSKVPRELINKPEKLAPTEWVTMQQHPVFGSEMVKPVLAAPIPLEIILHHHERLDGKGYPHKLQGSELLPEVKIAAFADVFDALTTNRSYQASRSKFEALMFIRDHIAHVLDKDVFKAMVALLKQG